MCKTIPACFIVRMCTQTRFHPSPLFPITWKRIVYMTCLRVKLCVLEVDVKVLSELCQLMITSCTQEHVAVLLDGGDRVKSEIRVQ